MSLNINAAEWKPTGNTVYTDVLSLPPSNVKQEEGGNPPLPVDDDDAAETTTTGTKPPLLNVNSPAFVPQQYTGRDATNALYPSSIPTAVEEYIPSFLLGQGSSTPSQPPSATNKLDWSEEFNKVMRLTEELIREQLEGPSEEEKEKEKDKEKGRSTDGAAPSTAAVSKAPGKTSPAPSSASPSANDSQPSRRSANTANAPLTIHGNHRWKKLTKGQQKRELSQKKAFEEFAAALLHSVSPFMAPLRELCHSSLPHLKLDQRFGKSGQPQSALAQFIVAPVITTYRPRHFHDLSPGDLLEFHYELFLVLTKGIPEGNRLVIGYGPTWKRYAVPYLYLHAKNYAQVVRRMCPEEVPNTRAEALYESDIVKNITEVILAVEELEILHHISLLEAMKRRIDLSPLYDAFNTIFEPIENYTIEVVNFHLVPTQFLLKASQTELSLKPQPLVLYGDPTLWEELPVVSRVVVVDHVSGSDDEGESKKQHHPGAPAAPASYSQVTSQIEQTTTTTSKRKRKKQNNSSNLFIVWLPALVSVACVAATVTVFIAREKAKQK